VTQPRDDRRLKAAAALLLEREVVPGPAPVPSFADLLATGARRRRRRVAGLGLVVAGAVAGLFAARLTDRAPISYVVAGAAAIDRAGVEAPSAQAGGGTLPARLHFSEGTEVTLAAGGRLNVTRRTSRGAVLELEHGQARFQVVHRRGTRWSVVAGPFVVEVTGTEFTVDWSPAAGRMVVDLKVGTVRVGGASVGGTVELHPGERLVATAADHRLTLSPDDLSPERGSASAADEPRAEAASPEASGRGAPQPSRVVVDGSWRRADEAAVPPRAMLALRSPRQGVSPAQPALPQPELPEAAVPVLGQPAVRAGEAARGPRLDPAPVGATHPSPIPQSLTMGGGGLFCVTVPAQYSFEDAASGLSAPRAYTLALARPRVDRTHSWCGESSVRLDAAFDDSGRRNFFGRYPNETGQLLVRLDRPTDLTGKTVTMHVFVEGPPDVRFSAEIAAVQRGGWASSPPVKELAPGRWWTISHRFGVENPTGVAGSSNPFPYPTGGASTVAETDRLALAIHTTGDRRAWKGAVYIDDISW